MTGSSDRSPRIESVSWGRIEVAGHGTFKDAKLFPGGAREWDWGETGTRHSPGIQPADVEELLENGARVVVLSRGMLTRLRVGAETLQELEIVGAKEHFKGAFTAQARLVVANNTDEEPEFVGEREACPDTRANWSNRDTPRDMVPRLNGKEW